MIAVTLEQLAEDVHGSYTGSGDTLARDLSTDTRTIEHGAVFAAIKGARVDGAELAGDALAAGPAGEAGDVAEIPLDVSQPSKYFLVWFTRAAPSRDQEGR